jgi:hypothetical protein
MSFSRERQSEGMAPGQHNPADGTGLHLSPRFASLAQAVRAKLLLIWVLAAAVAAAMTAAPAAAACDEAAHHMSLCDAKSFVKFVANYRSGHKVHFSILRCKRLTDRSFRCGVKFRAGDLVWRGAARVGFRDRSRFDDYYFFRLTFRKLNTGAKYYLHWRCPRVGTCG